jgi:hypothetical protein
MRPYELKKCNSDCVAYVACMARKISKGEIEWNITREKNY